MLDIQLIRNHPDTVRAGLVSRNDDPALVDKVSALDTRWRDLLQSVESLRAERNKASKEIGRLRDRDDRASRIAEMREVNSRLSALEAELREVEASLNDARLVAA